MQLTSGMVGEERRGEERRGEERRGEERRGEERRGEERRGEEKAHIIGFLGEVFVSSHTAFLRDSCPRTSNHRTNGYPVVERGKERKRGREGERKGRREGGKEGRREGSDRGK